MIFAVQIVFHLGGDDLSNFWQNSVNISLNYVSFPYFCIIYGKVTL